VLTRSQLPRGQPQGGEQVGQLGDRVADPDGGAGDLCAGQQGDFAWISHRRAPEAASSVADRAYVRQPSADLVIVP
jgi:hypothetical protein